MCSRQGQTVQHVCFSLPSSRNNWPRPLINSEKKSLGKHYILIDPSQVSVVGPVDLNQSTASATSTNASLDDSSVKKELSELKDEWSTRLARIEALLTMGFNPISSQTISAVRHIAPVFSPVKVKVALPPSTGVLSSSPFLPHTVSSPPPPSRFGSEPRTGISC